MNKIVFFVLGAVIFSAGCLGQGMQTNQTDQSTKNTEEDTTQNQTSETDNQVNESNTSDTNQNDTQSDTTKEDSVSYSILADDNGFYIDGSEITSIDVSSDSEVTITFEVSTESTYYGGLDFRSENFNSPDVPPGETWTTTFMADSDFTIKSYWPSSNVKKAEIDVNIS